MSRWASGRSRDWVSCWPWRSTRSAPSCARTLTVVGLPLTQARERPSAEMSRFRTSRPSSTSTPKAAKGGKRRERTAGANSNAPSITVFSAPGRTTSDEARSPRRRASASTSMDFPAPVSPVRALRPGGRGFGGQEGGRAGGGGGAVARHDNGVAARNDDRPARRQRVRRGAGGRGHHDPVRRVLPDFVAVYGHAEPDHARHAALVHHSVVQHDWFGATPALLVLNERRQGETRLGDVGPAHEGAERAVEGLRGSGGQEADPTEAYPQDRCMGAVERPGPAQQGPVAPQGDQAVELRRPVERRGRGGRLGAERPAFLLGVQGDPEPGGDPRGMRGGVL